MFTKLCKSDEILIGSQTNSATPEMNYNMSPTSASVSTLASSNYKKDEDVEFEMNTESDDMPGMPILSKSHKGPQSKERKLSNEDCMMLPPRAQEGNFLRPKAKVASAMTAKSVFSNESQPALKPMTILGFLQQKAKDATKNEGVEKAEPKSIFAFNLTSSSDEAGISIPTITMS